MANQPEGQGLVDPLQGKLRSEYVRRFNRVIDHVQHHLDQPLGLEELAQVACFSPFHFHRMFRCWMGETIHQFVLRLRLEKAACQLLLNSSKSITEIALDCGFSSSATFARAFRECYELSASEYRKTAGGQNRKKRKTNGNPCKEEPGGGLEYWAESGRGAAHLKETSMTPALTLNVQVQDLPPMTVAYIRHIGSYKGNSALFGRLFGKLAAWAGPRGLMGPESICLSIYQDNPDFTPEDKQRVEVAVSIPETTVVEGEVGKLKLEGGRYAMARIEILPSQYEEAWESFMNGWLPDSGYQPDDRPALEIYLNDPSTHPEGKHIVDLCLPVKAL